MKKQQGTVLFFALIVLVLMTMIGVGLATNAGLSLRMAGTGSERLDAITKVQGAQKSLIADKDVRKLVANMIMLKVLPADLGSQLGTKNVLVMLRENTSCQRSSSASSTNLLRCHRVEITTTAEFGRHKVGKITQVIGVEQEILTGS